MNKKFAKAQPGHNKNKHSQKVKLKNLNGEIKFIVKLSLLFIVIVSVVQ